MFFHTYTRLSVCQNLHKVQKFGLLMEKFHMQVGRQIQGLSPTTCGAASYILLGWSSIETLFDTAKLLYVMRLLTQIYNSTNSNTNRLTELRFWRASKVPLSELWAVARIYHLADSTVQLPISYSTGQCMSCWHDIGSLVIHHVHTVSIKHYLRCDLSWDHHSDNQDSLL